jgi:hypothetical protein
MTACFENGSVPSGSMKCWEFLVELCYHWLLKKPHSPSFPNKVTFQDPIYVLGSVIHRNHKKKLLL